MDKKTRHECLDSYEVDGKCYYLRRRVPTHNERISTLFSLPFFYAILFKLVMRPTSRTLIPFLDFSYLVSHSLQGF